MYSRFDLVSPETAGGQVHLDAFHVHLAQAHHHKTGEEKEHDVDQRNDLDPRFLVWNGRAYTHWIFLNRRAFPGGGSCPGDLHLARRCVCASNITSRFVAAVCSSNSKLDTREVKKLKGIRRENGDAETAGRGDERFRDTAGDGLHSQLFVAEKTERLNKTGNRSQQTEQRRQELRVCP